MLKPYFEFRVLKHDQPLSIIKLKELIHGVVEVLGMSLLGPVAFRKGTKAPGWTGVAIIEESHVAFHSFDNQNETWLSIVSCKPFSVEALNEYLESVNE